MNLGISEMMFLAVIGLLLFGPKKLPEIGRQIGKALAEFKRASNEFQAQLNEEVRKLEEEVNQEKEKTIAPSRPEGATERKPATYSLETNSGQHEAAMIPESSSSTSQGNNG